MPTDPVLAAHTAAEAIRELNHATIRGTGYTWPADVDAIVVELHLCVARMEQALDQARQWLEGAHASKAVGHDQGTDASVAMTDTASRFAATIDTTHQLTECLVGLRNLTVHLTGMPLGVQSPAQQDSPVEPDGLTTL